VRLFQALKGNGGSHRGRAAILSEYAMDGRSCLYLLATGLR
jgi:hypothetical protein